MRVAVVSDVHGNRQAFEAVLDAIAESDCRELWCLGDLVGYGADPDACVALARENAAVCLAGNHDLGVTGAIPLEQFSRGAALAATWTRETITPETRAFLESLEPQRLDEAVGLYHASPRDPVWEYVLSPCRRSCASTPSSTGSPSSGTRTWRSPSRASPAPRRPARPATPTTSSTSKPANG